MKHLSAGLTALVLTATLIATPVGASDPPTQPYGARDGAITALNILPPGQGEYQNGPEQASGQQSPHNFDQIEPYDRMVQGAPGITKGELDKYFKDATFGVKADDIAREYSPRDGVTVLRDKGFGVPHVYGTTRDDVMFGAGYVSAEDRLFMMDTLRHVGRGRLSEFLGASEANLASDRAVYRSAGYSEEELEAMIERLKELDPELGPLAYADLMAYVDGINQYIAEARIDPRKLPAEYEALQIVPEDWKPTDTVAVASLIGSQLGVGGGGEVDNASFIGALEKKGFTFRQARKILRDFNFPDDPESPVTTSKRFVWNTNLGKLDKRSRAFPDNPASVQDQYQLAQMPSQVDAPWGPIPLTFPDAKSNALLVGSDLSASGRPVGVIGPQVAYWSPEILMELDVHGPGIDARGVGFPGISQYVLLGRGADYAWSATSAGGDQVDTFVEKLCEPGGGEATVDSNGYMKDGKCVEMYSRTDTWEAKPTAAGVPPETVVVEMTTQRTDSGIVQARGKVNGKPVAFTELRASFMKEVDSALTYVEISDPERINGPEDFQRAFARFTFTFNWFYLDDEDIAFQLGGTHPLRARNIDPDLPVWGTGEWDWRGSLSFANTPKDINPKRGWMTSWNNKQAPGFRANDRNFSYGPVQRVQLLNDKIKSYKKRKGKISLVDLVNIMGDAGTTDLRGTRVLPFMLKVVGKPSDERLQRAVKLLKAWRRSGAHRRDKDADGSYEHSPAVALMDAWWEPAAKAIFEPTLGRRGYKVLPMRHHDNPRAQGSAFQSGFYSQINKDLRTVLGLKVRGKASRIYCGKGSLARCRKVVTKSLDAAVTALEEKFGKDPKTWDVDEAAEQINFTPVGLQDQPNMQWQNRPTFQQVLEFGTAKL